LQVYSLNHFNINIFKHKSVLLKQLLEFFKCVEYTIFKINFYFKLLNKYLKAKKHLLTFPMNRNKKKPFL